MTGNALWPYLVSPEDQGRDDLCAVSASGHRVRFADGADLLCGTSGLWNVNLGYGNAVIADAIAAAARDASYLTVFRYENRTARSAAEALVRVCGPDDYARVIFSTSGGAANDAAMKLARHYHALRGDAARTVLVGLRNSYHGLTFGGFALTGEDLGQRLYGVDQRLVRHLPPNSVPHLTELLGREGRRIAAVVVEPVQGSGAVPLTEEYVGALLELRDRYGFLVVADEVATGFGRTGDFLATHRWPSAPDVLLLSKALTNGTCAAAAIVVSPAVADAFTWTGSTLGHAETQGGTAVTCAAVLATLAEMDRLGAVDNARKLGDRLAAELADPSTLHPLVTGVTGIGCFWGLRLRTPGGGELPQTEVGRVVHAIRRAGVIVHPGPAGVQLVPALTYTDADLTELLDGVRRGLDAYARGTDS
ncbi:daptide-type RiPP biosynthesis aminotransferase [Polymorphospora rubra]|uniref:daptide-type RiPP biosynthesis aminotransferase n=1 Tax=Polymorphospora rubra TaxID=338584 RepID=UPI0033FEF097